MAIMGIVLLCIGIMLLNYTIKALGGPTYNCPLIFHNTPWRNIIILGSIAIFISGLICLWMVNAFVAILPVAFILFWAIWGFFLSKDDARATLFFKSYKIVKANNNFSDEETLKEAAKMYLQRHSALLTGDRLDRIIQSVFDINRTREILTGIGETDKEINDYLNEISHDGHDPEKVAYQVLYWEDCLFEQWNPSVEKNSKRFIAIDKAYKKVIGSE